MARGDRPPTPYRRRAALVGLFLLVAGLVVFALSRLDLSKVGSELVGASPGWIVLAVALMGSSLVLRSISWQQALRAALPGTPVAWAPVTRATMIGVMGSAVFPGRIGEPSRVLVVSRHIDGSRRRLLPILAGTVFSQTLMNLLALGVLAIVTFSAVPLGGGHVTGIVIALAIPLAIAGLVVSGPRIVAQGRRSRHERVRGAAESIERLLRHARQGLTVFARPRYGATAVTLQLLAWALQWLACYTVLLALGLQDETNFATAAAVLLAVNVSAVLPATPSNVGVFQAACLVVLAAYGVGAGKGLAYGILLQAVEVVTALALGVPALLREGVSWSDLRREAGSAGDEGA
ncbi:MAG TPA: lysylphosphatidylglycerol synthase transmembrane domain-containing protein [Solirubrobacteraceae bacterium]|nr:lysylphosphatidylglycerol synthase transmembrane domain-containing protein [Solirubrobacteraceae bacterium]